MFGRYDWADDANFLLGYFFLKNESIMILVSFVVLDTVPDTCAQAWNDQNLPGGAFLIIFLQNARN